MELHYLHSPTGVAPQFINDSAFFSGRWGLKSETVELQIFRAVPTSAGRMNLELLPEYKTQVK